MRINNYSMISTQYASIDNTGTTFLAFKTIPELLKRYKVGKKTLDYGCGTGSSILFLKDIGLDVEGVDISAKMLEEAKQLNKETSFQLIKSAELPFADETFDLVFSSFVWFEMGEKSELKKVIDEVYRVLKKGGLYISVTGSEELYIHEWLSLDVNFEQNKNLKSGDIAKVLLKDANLIVYDYFWTDKDYNEVIQNTHFDKVETLYPLGTEEDGYPWADEKNFPPYVVYVLLK